MVGVGLGGVTAGHNCDGSQPVQAGQAADQASVVGQADAGTRQTAQTSRQPSGAPVAQRVLPRCQRQSLTAILPDCPHTLTVAQSGVMLREVSLASDSTPGHQRTDR